MFNFAAMNIRDLEPTIVWNHFADLNNVPRPSKKEDNQSQYSDLNKFDNILK